MLGRLSIALLSDGFRVPKMAITVLLIVFLGAYHASFSIERPQGYRAYMDAPSEHDGARVLLPLWEVTGVGDEGLFYVSKSVLDVPIVGSSTGLTEGDTVTIVGHFRGMDGAVIAAQRVDHPWRKAKGLLSILALLIGFVLVPRFFSWSAGRVVIRG